ncbi:hypothetical protein [Novosphingobium olei]|uniref:Uncharacterized protein n=1 Tax=Novosphingobium olei TaxID=2728851 RepID=A0A7Y0G7W4_9SPHN|nr:hypothetical protein [Novosphingobium olei]NML92376.1 hypothetical protein [Novosphingobium olei]BEV01768.1 hypothetical protein NSDW_28620 [Novosphingobium olei]
MPHRSLEICPVCRLPVPECDAIQVARGVALRFLRDYAGYAETEALAALERNLPFAFHHHPPAPGAPRAPS